ncbi:hypothetical protein OHB25_49260 [Streptomyces mirabilis]|uniref:hypothetical protein n=1 Tax=Streptomyces TaxID=1883 RepID=UPI0011636545|nr:MULTISPECIES: hypothetical protein [Streptomyces]MCX4615911.1 hypothetical protein [Streptomyces mirabilis]MCX5347314.1 hypothetical protein [Streptomyces mirabilis]QDN86022.1 hypothetical protein FNV61_10780 [Streptomyces sp. RLB3-6]QDO06833.1 hypothetical protein FNV68_11880 [Streptomyces sp. S1D4-23]
MFGKDHSQQLQGILEQLAALRQQVENQQRSIDRIDTATIAAARDHLNDTREVVRRALGENRDVLIGQLASISSDLATLRANAQRFGEERPPEPTAATKLEQSAATDQEADGKEDKHPKLLLAAAGISAAEFRVHRDTWAFLVEHAGHDPHFHIPGGVEEKEGIVKVQVSGPSLVAAFTSLRAVYEADGADPGTAAIARHVYGRIAKTVKAVAKDAHSGTGGDPVAIVIDDRIKSTGEQAANINNDQRERDPED